MNEDQITDALLSALYAIESLGDLEGSVPVKAENAVYEALEKVKEALKSINGYAPLNTKARSLYYPEPSFKARRSELIYG